MMGHHEFELRDEYMVINISGTYSRNDFFSVIEEIKANCEKAKLTKVLINALELRDFNLSTTDRYFLGEKLGQEFKTYIKLAVVWSAEHIDQFAQIVAANRGVNMHVGFDLKTAEEWLLKGPGE